MIYVVYEKNILIFWNIDTFMNFKDFLLSEAGNIAFTRWSNDGIIVVNVNGQRYEYNVNPAHHAILQRIAKYKPFTALSEIKKLVDKGSASQIFPVVQPKNNNLSLVQKQLF